MTARRRMDPDARRAQIIASAREAFLQHGFAGTRVRDIAEQAGITEKLVYVRFTNKAEIYQAAVTNPLDRLVEQLVSEIGGLGDEAGRDRQAVFERFHRVLLASMLDTAPLLTVALFSRPERGRQYYTEQVLPRFTAAIGSVVSDVTGWSADSIEFDVMVEGVLGLHFGLALATIFDEKPVDVDETAHQIAKIFGGGLVAKVTRNPRVFARSGEDRVYAFPPGVSAADDAQQAEQSADTPGGNAYTRKERANTRRPGGRLARDARRSAIARAARQVFIERGAAAARTKDIAERAGITEAFMFRVFESKDELYRVAIEEPTEHLLNRLAAQIHEVVEQGGTGPAVLDEVIVRSIGVLTRLAPMVIVALFSELQRGREFYPRAVLPAIKQVRDDLSRVPGWNTAGIDPDVLWRALLGVQFGTVVLRGLTGAPIDPADISRRLGHLILSGIR